MKSGTVNNLNDVFQYHCKDALPLDKSSRDIFVKGSIELINKQFQVILLLANQESFALYINYIISSFVIIWKFPLYGHGIWKHATHNITWSCAFNISG